MIITKGVYYYAWHLKYVILLVYFFWANWTTFTIDFNASEQRKLMVDEEVNRGFTIHPCVMEVPLF